MTKKTQELVITSDVYKSFKGAGYGAAFNALEDALDNSLIGLDDPRLPDDHIRNIVVEFFNPNDTLSPDTIKIYDNGIGMSKVTVGNKLYVTTAVSATAKIKNGGTSRWGLGYNQFTHYLGEPGRVITSEIGEDKPFESQCVYEDGKAPSMESVDLPIDHFKHEMTPLGDVNYGTMIEITNVDGSKFVKEWWSPSKNTWYKSIQNRYNRLLSSGKITITFKLHTGAKTKTKVLVGGEKFLDNKGSSDKSWEKPGGQYEKSTNNQFDVLGETINYEGVNIPIKFGKHLSAIQRKVWISLGTRHLLCGSPARSAIPTIYVYQNNILLGSIKYKASERTGGIAHLNGLFVELDLPKDYIVPTNTTKNGFDKAWQDYLKPIIQEYVENHENGYPTADIRESQWHDAFEAVMYEEGPIADAKRKHVFGKDISVEDMKDNLSHEKAHISSKPDFTYEDEEYTSLVEIKDEIADTSVVSQVARYYMNRGGEVKRVVVLARGFADSVNNEFKSWNKKFPKTEFVTINFSELDIDEHKVMEIAKKKQSKLAA